MNWNYIAGFVDGEGSIVKKGNGFRIFISQTNKEVLDEIVKFAKVGSVYQLTKRKKHWKDAWIYAITDNRNSYKFLKKIKNKLIVKKLKAKYAIKILNKFFEKERIKISLKIYRIKTATKLRTEGLTYREIAKKLDTDFGYIRRLIIK